MTRRELKRIGVLRRRAAHLAKRIQQNPGLSYDLQELSALQWVLSIVDPEGVA